MERFFMRQSPTEIVRGLRFTEGPSIGKDGVVYFSEIPRGRICRVQPGGEIETFLAAEAPNGTAFHPDGRLFFCDRDARVIGEADPNGRWKPFVDSWEGASFRGPNDCRFDPDGNLYFSDPFGSSRDNPVGSVYLATPKGRVHRILSGLAFPNGLAISGDGRTLFVAETGTARILRYDLDGHGVTPPGEVVCELDPNGVGPDGIDFDVKGNLFVAHYGAGHVDVIDPGGAIIETITTPGERTSNLEFDGTSLFVTVTSGTGELEDGRVVKYERAVPGLPTFAARSGLGISR